MKGRLGGRGLKRDLRSSAPALHIHRIMTMSVKCHRDQHSEVTCGIVLYRRLKVMFRFSRSRIWSEETCSSVRISALCSPW
jgi:hypothetical protein